MGLQLHTPFLPEGTEIVSEELAVHRTEEGWVFYNAGGPIGCCASDDEELKVALLVQFVRLGLLEHRAAAALLGVHRVTLYRTWRRMEAELAGTRGKVTRGPKGPHKMTDEVLKTAQQVLDHGASMAAAARAVGVDPTTVRLAVRQGTLRLPAGSTRRRGGRGKGEKAPELPLGDDAESVPQRGEAQEGERPGAPLREEADGKAPAAQASPTDELGEQSPGAEAAPDEASGGPRAATGTDAAREPRVAAPVELVGPGERAARDAECEAGVAVRRTMERALASRGKLVAALPVFEPADAVQYAGTLLALPMLLGEGLLEVGESVYGRLANGYYGLRSVLLMFGMMALLRIRTPEQLGSHAPGELGVLLGLDRAPEVKTLRRKLAEMGRKKRSTELAGFLAGRWAAADPERVGLLYVDGHVRIYHGRKHQLPKAFSQRRRMCVTATCDTWVNDRDGRPVFYVTAPANEGLLAMLDDAVLPSVQQLCAGQPLTIVFDREGWSPDRFRRWAEADIRVMTYRKGSYDDWAVEEFETASGRARGRRTLRLAERGVELTPGFWVREIRRLCANGHQTAIITTDFDPPIVEAAESMFDRWGQENFFRYARQDFALDHLVTRQVDPADPERLATNPEHKRLQKLLRTKKAELGSAEQELGRASLPGGSTGGKSPTELRDRAEQLRAEMASLAAQLAELPAKVPVGTLVPDDALVELERLTDTFKMLAYRAETTLANIVRPYYRRAPQEAHALLKSIYRTPAAITPDHEAGTLLVKLHGLATPRATRALAELCHHATETHTNYPGTALRMVFQTVDVAEP